MKKMKKYQGGGKGSTSDSTTNGSIFKSSGAPMDPRVAAFLKKRQASDTTKPYTREEMMETMNKIARGELKPRVDKPMAVGEGTKKYATVNKGDTTYMSKGDFEKKYVQKKKDGGKLVKKAKAGGAFGMLSVKAGIDKNPNPTQADRIAGAKKLAKSGKKVVKKVAKKLKSGGTVSSQLGSYKGVIGKNTKGKATKAVGLVKAKYGKSMGKCKNGC
jgi:hypothetical protein